LRYQWHYFIEIGGTVSPKYTLSSSNSGNAFANAGGDIVNACQTSFNLNASPVPDGGNGLWTIVSGTGGNLINPSHPNAQFVGQEGESYVLKWTVQHSGGSSSFDQLNVSIAVNTETSLANAGQDLFAIMTQTIVLNGNTPEAGSNGRWEILNGNGGILSDINDPTASFTGIPGQSYTLQWQHYNDCSTSTDEVSLTFSESAAGVPSSNGRYYIPDPRFRQYLQIAFPSVMDGDSLIVANGGQIERINLTNLDVHNLDGLQFLTNLESFIANGQVQSIPYFSSKLKRFECDVCNNLQIIPEFPASLDTINGRGWRISTMPDFPVGLRFLRLDYIPELSNMPIVPDSCLVVIISTVGQNCCPGEIMSLNIPAQAHYFLLENINMPSFPTLPSDHTKLEWLGIYSTNLSDMPSFEDFTKLKFMYLQNNSFLVLNYLPFVLQQIQVSGNPLICVKNKPPLVEDQLSEYPLCPPDN
jgi:hypothetical protein